MRAVDLDVKGGGQVLQKVPGRRAGHNVVDARLQDEDRNSNARQCGSFVDAQHGSDPMLQDRCSAARTKVSSSA